MRIQEFVLLPFTMIYGLITRLRNHLYNIDYTRSFRFDVPVIVVGNLSVGGSGKTPMVEYLIRLLVDRQTAVLSRGFRRATKGFLMADENSTAKLIGDEPMQYHLKFDVAVAVCEDRVEAIPKILFECPGTDLVIMDDGYQHRAVTPYLSILLTDSARTFTNDMLLPSGRLREARSEARRSDIIVVTKCAPTISADERNQIKNEIGKYNSDAPVFFTSIAYHKPISLNGSPMPSVEDVILLSGIAKSETLESYVKTNWSISEHLKYGDHHEYTSSDIDKICTVQNRLKIPILTTEKDAARLRNSELLKQLGDTPIYFLPISVSFINSGSEFDEMVLDKIRSF